MLFGWVTRLGRRMRHLAGYARAEHEMDEELRAHLEMEIADRTRGGMPPAEARRTALADFGGIERTKEDGRDARGVRPLEDLVRDLRYADRSLRRTPAFTLAAVATMAIGICATTVVVSEVSAILLRRPPVHEADRLFVINERWRSGITSSTDMARPVYPYRHYLDWLDAGVPALDGLAGYVYLPMSVRQRADARNVSGVVGANYFRVLGLRPAAGRFFSVDDERASAGYPEVVISYGLWQRDFGGDRSAIGQTLHVNSRPMTLVGVTPPGFRGTMIGIPGDAWIPAAVHRLPPVAAAAADTSLRPTSVNLTLFGRVRAGRTEEEARATLATVGTGLPPFMGQERMDGVRLEPLSGVPAMARGVVAGFMAILAAVAALVVLIAATNVAGMLLARAAHRRREIAMRLALGAGRGRVVRQLLAESVVLSGLGTGVGLLLAWWILRIFSAWQPPALAEVALDVRVDPLALWTSISVALVAGVFAGLTPALGATRGDVLTALRGASSGQSSRLGRLRRGFLVAQLAMSLVLLLTAGLFTRALQRSLTVNPGFDPDQVLVAGIGLRPHGYSVARGRAFYGRLLERLAAHPEFESVALAQNVPLGGRHNGAGIRLPGDEPQSRQRVNATWGVADERYFATVRIPLVAGRSFRARDDHRTPPVIIINETLAKRLWPTGSAVGQRLRMDQTEREVVGVVRDGKYRNLNERPIPFAFVPFGQSFYHAMLVHVRYRGDLGAAIGIVRSEVAALDRNIALDQPKALATVIDTWRVPQRVAAWFVGAFGLAGLVMAAIGIYGVLAYLVARRTREFGIRLSLGARADTLTRLVLREGFRLVAVGTVIGLAVAFAITRPLARFLYGIDAADPLTFIAAPVLLGAIAGLASYLPARRAARGSDDLAAR